MGNKVDLVTPARACLSHEEIRSYLGTFGDQDLTQHTPVIPISAQSELNIDALCHAIVHSLPKFSMRLLTKERAEASRSLLCANVIRSFDVNKAHELKSVRDIDRIVGGVLGGAVLSGHLEIGQEIEIRPGYIKKRPATKKAAKLSKFQRKMAPRWQALPIRTTVRSLRYGKHATTTAFAGGNVGVQTNVDPSLTKADGLCGHVIVDAHHPNPPPIFDKFKMSMAFVGKQRSFKCGEVIRVNIGSFKMKAEVAKRDVGDYGGVLCVLEAPICARIGDVVGVCRQNSEKELKGKTESMVHIRYQQRSGRKGVTTVAGLPRTIEFKPLAKRMKKKWSTNATLMDCEEMGMVIQLQGDLRHEIGVFVVKEGLVEKAQVRVHGY